MKGSAERMRRRPLSRRARETLRSHRKPTIAESLELLKRLHELSTCKYAVASQQAAFPWPAPEHASQYPSHVEESTLVSR